MNNNKDQHVNICQSCGMPLSKEDFGHNADVSINHDYCKFCFKDGEFTQNLTMDEMIDHCSQFVDEVNKNLETPITKEEYKNMMRSYFPSLKRWNNQK